MGGITVVVMGLILAFFYLAMLAVAITLYVLRAYGQMKMARSLGISRGWMAFLPFTDVFQLGCMAEKNTEPGRKPAPWRHLLLIGYIVFFLLYIGWMIFYVMQVFSITSGGELSAYDALQLFSGMIGFWLLFLLAAVVYSVLCYVAYYKIYMLFAPKSAVLFLILAIFVPVSASILFFILRNRKPNLPGVPDPDAWK